MNPFLDGVLEAAGPKAKLIDGNEFSYYYKTPNEFFQSYQMMRQKTKQFVAPELRSKFDSHVEAAQALYVDYVFNMRPDIFTGTDAATMTPEERARRFEQNVYYALDTSDEYAWLYSETMNWWKNESLPPGLEDAVVSARKKISDEQEFGLLNRMASIQRVPEGQAPKIDGVLDDIMYTNFKPLDPFVRFHNTGAIPAPVKAPTQAWVTYDNKNLYVAFHNDEPIIGQLQIHGPARDSDVWRGDNVEISIQPDPKQSSFYHLILNAVNTQWDGNDELGAADLTFNPNWQSATARGKNEWVVEAAIPWSELKLKAPESGMTLRANLARLRTPVSELTSWSQFQSGFQEVHNFGTWVFQ